MPTTTPSFSIEHLAADQTVVLQTPTGKHMLPAKPLFNALHQHFPDASFAVLEILLNNNALYGLHVAHQHRLFKILNIEKTIQR